MSDSYCHCPCHTSRDVFCSCFVPCCHEPHVPQAKQTARPERPPVDLKFSKVEVPAMRTQKPYNMDIRQVLSENSSKKTS